MRLSVTKIIISVLTINIIGITYLFAQNFKIKYLTNENGLSNNAVNAIFQDHDGFMWFGTYDGLNRYDGYGFKVFRNVIGDSSSISSNAVNAIDEDDQHRIWVGGQKEISIYDGLTGRFSIPHYKFYDAQTKIRIKDNVVAVKSVGGHAMLIGTQHNGLFYFSSHLEGRQVPLSLPGKIVTDYYVTAIEFDKERQAAFVFIQDQGLYTYDLEKQVLVKKNNAILTANCLNIDASGQLWLGNNDGLFRLSANNQYEKMNVPSRAPAVGISEDRNGSIWVASDGGGVWLLAPGSNTAVALSSFNHDDKQFINSNAVYALYIDKDERKWVGTLRGGVNIIEPTGNLFSTVLYQPGSANNSVQNFILSFCEDSNNNVWIGTDGAGLRYWNRSDNSFRNYVYNSADPNSISSNFITGIVKDKAGDFWISSWRGGVDLFKKSTQAFQHYSFFNPRTKANDNNVWFVFEDSRQRLWAGAVRNGGLYRLDTLQNQFQYFDDLPELQCMAEDDKGNLWAGDYTSLILIDTLNKRHHRYDIGYTVRCIHEDVNKNFWIGTQEAGLLLFDRKNGTFKRFTTTDGLPSNTILRMLEDKEGNLWLSTYNGLSKFNVRQKTVRNFSQADGLQSNQFSYNAALALSSGEFMFGGIKGFNIFYPADIKGTKPVPEIFLSSLKINNRPIQECLSYVKENAFEQIRKIEVPYSEASLSIDFLGLDYADAADLNYEYTLQGWDKNWNTVNETHTANYSRLQEGDYVFEVKVSNAGGNWSNPKQLLYITILPPWYRTWWAYSLYVLLIASAIYVYAVYKNRQAKLKYEVQLAHLETQKEKELNEKKIAFFTNVSHEFRTPLSLIINPIKDLLQKQEASLASAELKVIHRNAQRLLRLVDQLLLFKKADADELHLVPLNFYSLCNDVFACFTEQARSRKIKYELICDNDIKSLQINADREKIEIALFNILSNAFKYTPSGGSIGITVIQEQQQLRVSVADSGPGIANAEGEKLFDQFYQVKDDASKGGFGIGLYLVKNFITAHNGTVEYKSEKGSGTTFIITLPLTGESVLPVSTDEENRLHSIQQPVNKHSIIKQPAQEQGETHKQHSGISPILSEINEAVPEDEMKENGPGIPQQLASDQQQLLIIDDDNEMRNYLISIFTGHYKIYHASNATEGIKLAHRHLPDLIISDIIMPGPTGIDLCKMLKEDSLVSHIPIILLTASSSDETQLKGIETGADDYIKKPFDKDILVARVNAILKRRNVLQNYFYNEITLGNGSFKVSAEYKEFLERCMKIIEEHLDDDAFSIKTLAAEIGMSHSNLYKKIKTMSGLSVNGFIRFIRLKKAAEIFINTQYNVNETAAMVGFFDIKYFRAQFFKLFGLNPSDYIKKFRKPFQNTQTLDDMVRN